LSTSLQRKVPQIEPLEFLAEETSADRIRVIGYGAGTRAVLTALHQLRLARTGRARQAIRRELRLGTVALIGSDANRGLQRDPSRPVWMFPADDSERLEAAAEAANEIGSSSPGSGQAIAASPCAASTMYTAHDCEPRRIM
jgi:hypothetical protein